jgi:hypothetical protein
MPSGSSMPCNLPPVRYLPGAGSDRIVTPSGEVATGKIIDPTSPFARAAVDGYMPHWATCPAAAKFKQKGKQ